MAKKGTPIVCPDCNSESRYFALSRCEPCYYKIKYEREQARRLEYARRYRKENPDKVLACNRKSYRYSATQRRNVRHYALRTKYGMTEADFDEMLAGQNGKCAICSVTVVVGDERHSHQTACVDHCHATGAVRGILCNRCNKGLGMFEDDLPRFRRVMRYLESDYTNPRFRYRKTKHAPVEQNKGARK